MKVSTPHIHSILLAIIIVMLSIILVIGFGISTSKTGLGSAQAQNSFQAQENRNEQEISFDLDEYRIAISESSRLRAENESLKEEIAKLQDLEMPAFEVSVTPDEQGRKYASYVADLTGLALAMDERKDLSGFGDLFNDEAILSLYDSILVNHGIEQLRGQMLFSWEFSPSERADWAVAALSENLIIGESKIKNIKSILNDAYTQTKPMLMNKEAKEKVSNQVKEGLELILTDEELEYYRTLFPDSWIPRPINLFN